MGKSIKLGGGGGRSLEVKIKDTGKVYHVPLADSLAMGDAMALRKAQRQPKRKRQDAYFNAIYEIFCRYIPKKYIDQLSLDDFSRLADAWNDASNDTGVGAGE